MNMIEVKNVTMKFRLASDKIQSLKEYFIAMVTRKLKYKELCVFRDLNFEIKKGEVVGIIGRNGAGKSTLLKIISGVLAPTEGSVKINGNIVPMLELGSGFDIELSGRENIFLNGSILGYSQKFLEEKYQEIVEFSELGEFIEEPIRNYSSGMLMRLAFSIATIVHPEILIVDEILAVGDEAFQRKSKRKMLELMGGGTTVLFVSHSIDQIREMCSRVIWIENGHIEKDGEAKEVCDAYQKFLNPEKDIYKGKKLNLRNVDAYKYLMDVLIVYNEDWLSFYTALARKEQLLAGNMCAQELCMLDLNMEVLKQYRMVLFINCKPQETEAYISEIQKKNKTFLVECHSEAGIRDWKKNYPQIEIISTNEKMKNEPGVLFEPVPITERLQQVSEWAKYDRDILPFKKVDEIEGEQEFINYNRAVREKKGHLEDGKRLGIICDKEEKKIDYAKECAYAESLNLTARMIFNGNFEETIRAISQVDFVLDLSGEKLACQLNHLLCDIVKVPYCSTHQELESCQNDFKTEKSEKINCTTIKTSVQFLKLIKSKLNRSIVYLLESVEELEKHPAILKRIETNLKDGFDVSVYVTTLKGNEKDSFDGHVSIINRAIKYVLGSLDVVVVVNEKDFSFIVTYPNIQKRIYYVFCWEPENYDLGDFRRIQANQTYLPYMPIEFWTNSLEVRDWLEIEYGQEAMMV